MTLIHLLRQNGLTNCYHELSPDFIQEGIEYYYQSAGAQDLATRLRKTRAGVFFEANNRLFSLSYPIKLAFPQARFVFLFRDGRDVVRSGLQRKWYRHDDRFRSNRMGTAAHTTQFMKVCHYWAEVNRRILDDLQALSCGYLSLRFEDLVHGQEVACLQRFLRVPLAPCKYLPTANQTANWSVPAYADWSSSWQRQFDEICGPMMQRLGYSAGSDSTNYVTANLAYNVNRP